MVHPALRTGGKAVITGAGAGGIGFAVAKILLTRFQFTVILADNSKTSLEAAERELTKDSVPAERFHTQLLDVSKPDDMFSFADTAFEKLGGKIHFLHLNAGVSMPTKSYGGREELEKWNKILDVNMGGVLNGSQAFVHRMVEQDEPAIVVVSGSKQGLTLPPGNPACTQSSSLVT